MTSSTNKLDKRQLHAKLLDTGEHVSTKTKRSRLIKIIDSNDKKANLDKDDDESKDDVYGTYTAHLLDLLHNCEYLFDSSLCDVDTPPVHLDVKEGSEPVHSRPFPALLIHRDS